MLQKPEIPEPEYEDPKEIYAFFGLAYYHASVLEQGVLNLAVALLAKNIPGVTADDVHGLFDSFDKKTFGQIINAARTKFVFPNNLEAELADALSHRNYLAHKFFRVHDSDLLSSCGRRKMIDELIEILKQIMSTDAQMDELWKRAWTALGITKECIEQFTEKFIAEQTGNHPLDTGN